MTTVPLTRRKAPVSLIAIFVTIVFLAAAPFWASRGTLNMLMEALAFLALAQMWNLLAGYTGLISVGQQAWVGLGGYLFFALAMFSGLPLLIALPVAALLSGLIAFPIGWIAFRLQGAYFAIGTWVIAEVFRLIAAQFSALGGGSGISLPIDVVKSLATSRGARDMVMYYIAFGLGIGSVMIVWLMLRSKWGLAFTGIRDSEPASESIGIRIRRVKFMVYIATAASTALTGGFIFLQKLRITPDAAFSVNEWSAFIIFIVVIGGIGSIEGPILGVILFFTLRSFAADWGRWYLITLGALAIGVMLVDRQGMWSILKSRGVPVLFKTTRWFEP